MRYRQQVPPGWHEGTRLNRREMGSKLNENNKLFEEKKMNKIFGMAKPELCGWLGMILVQSATLPTTIGNIMGWTHVLPPLSMVFLCWSGLFLYFIRAYYQKDTLYMVSNGFGFFVNSILLSLIVFPWG